MWKIHQILKLIRGRNYTLPLFIFFQSILWYNDIRTVFNSFRYLGDFNGGQNE